jgi:hypothetical protein
VCKGRGLLRDSGYMSRTYFASHFQAVTRSHLRSTHVPRAGARLAETRGTQFSGGPNQGNRSNRWGGWKTMSGIHENKFVTNFDARAVREDREVRQTSHFLYESSTHPARTVCRSRTSSANRLVPLDGKTGRRSANTGAARPEASNWFTHGTPLRQLRPRCCDCISHRRSKQAPLILCHRPA